MDNLPKRIQAVLFINGEPVAIDRLAKILGGDKTRIRQAAEELDQKLSGTALTLVWKGDSLQLVTRSEFAKDVETLVKEEVSRDISRAAAETIAIVAYRGPVTRMDIDYIRGVNSSYTLRNLLVRGLIERKTNPKDGRTYVYQTSLEFLKFLGLNKTEDLPQYSEFVKKMDEFLSAKPPETCYVIFFCLLCWFFWPALTFPSHF